MFRPGVVFEDWIGELVIRAEAMLRRGEGVVLALTQPGTVVIAKALANRWAGDQVVNSAAGGAAPACRQTLQQNWFRHIEMNQVRSGVPEGVEEMGEVMSLVDRARVTVDEKAFAAIGLSEARDEQIVDDGVGNQLTGGEKSVDFSPERRLGSCLAAEHIARGDGGDAEAIPKKWGLSPFAATWRTKK